MKITIVIEDDGRPERVDLDIMADEKSNQLPAAQLHEGLTTTLNQTWTGMMESNAKIEATIGDALKMVAVTEPIDSTEPKEA